MAKTNPLINNRNGVKCYKSTSCIISIMIIVFIFGSILYDFCYSKPKIRQDIDNINNEIRIIDQRINKIDSQQIMSSERFLEELKKYNTTNGK